MFPDESVHVVILTLLVSTYLTVFKGPFVVVFCLLIAYLSPVFTAFFAGNYELLSNNDCQLDIEPISLYPTHRARFREITLNITLYSFDYPPTRRCYSPNWL